MTGWSRSGTWVVGGAIAIIALAQAGSGEPDAYWQVRAGRDLLADGRVVRPDTWSYAPVGGDFFPNSPGWNVALAWTWELGGSWGLAVLTLALTAGCLTLAAMLASRAGAHALPTAAALVIGSLAAFPVYTVRAALPAIIVMLVMLLLADSWTRRAWRYRAGVSGSLAFAVALLLCALGNWVHTSWATLAVIVSVALAVRWLPDRSLTWARRLALLGGAVVGLLAGVALGPYGWSVWERTGVVASTSRDLITEWTSALVPGASPAWAVLTVVVTLLAVSAAVVAFLGDRTLSSPRTALVLSTAVPAVAFALAGLFARRFVPVAAIALMPSLAVMLTAAVSRLDARLARRNDHAALRERITERYWAVIWAAVLVLLMPIAVVMAAPHMEPPGSAAVRALPADCRLFSTDADSAAAVLLRPDVRVWIDGRSDYWGRERLALAIDYLLARSPSGLVPGGTTCVVLPDDAQSAHLAPLRAALDASPQWQRVGVFGDRIVWLPAG